MNEPVQFLQFETWMVLAPFSEQRNLAALQLEALL